MVGIIQGALFKKENVGKGKGNNVTYSTKR